MTGVPLDSPPARPHVQSLSCPSCGAAIELRAQGWAVSVVCASCGSVLDATDANLRILQRHREATNINPLLSLGTRGTWRGAPWELIGFQVVTITVDGVDYSWTEYVAFNPYRGFLYLSEYQGHWNVIEKLRKRPMETSSGGRPAAVLDGREFKHFQTAQAVTSVALGEFPWELRVGDSVIARDFIAPPDILSAESTDGETTWSLGTYTPGDVIAKAFPPRTKLPRAVGVFANQPNPHVGSAGAIFKRLGVFLLLLLAMLAANVLMASNAVVYTDTYSFTRGTEDSAAFVTPAFDLTGRPSSVAVDVETDVSNDWVYFDFTLIEDSTGASRDFSKQVSYYFGRDSDGNWSEGSRRGSLRLSSVPPGRYFLRVAPEGGEPMTPVVNYTLRVRRDVPGYGFYVVALVALVIPAFLLFLPRVSFETQRWAESDYGSGSGSSEDDDE